MRCILCSLAVSVLVVGCAVRAAEPCVSGPKVGQRPGPYTSVVSVGEQRGKSHCFICETEDRPAVIVFARTLNDPLAQLVRGLDRALATQKKAELRAWVTFLNDDQPGLDPKVTAWARKHAIRSVPLGIFEDVGGPPTYRLHRDADVTVLLSAKQKVVRNFALRTGDLTEAKVKEILAAVTAMVVAKK
jgi:hypothetical protein